MSSYRIGIDVGGTFTDAVVIDSETLEVVKMKKVPTTHDSKGGVADGIIEVLQEVIRLAGIEPADVDFIAHGTTQATNALLEGDVSKVGILGMGPGGIEGARSKNETRIGNVALNEKHDIEVFSNFLHFKELSDDTIDTALQKLLDQGAEVMVASASFGVDDPEPEEKVIKRAQARDIVATPASEITKLYGLQIRTRTAVVNASILPRMINTANMTEYGVKSAEIKAPFMVMRGDGGVMNIDEMRTRPLLTMLSGPAAGVAGALMYERVSDGIFLEVGGTSTDMSVIQDGQVKIKYAEIGGHRTYMNSLDTRTIGLAGGSMLRVEKGKIVEVGPRSAHIAGLVYPVFCDASLLEGLEVTFVKPRQRDRAEYIALKNRSGSMFAVTLTDIANAMGLVTEDSYSYGDQECAGIVLKTLADYFKKAPEEMGEQIMDLAFSKVNKVLEDFINDYELEREHLILVGGGGGAATVLPYASRKSGLDYKITRNAEYISTIGVALAAVRDIVERHVPNPTPEDVVRIRREAEQAAIKSGASPETVEITVEIDKQRSIMRAIATGATELREKGIKEKLSPEALKELAVESMGLPQDQVAFVADDDVLMVYQGEKKGKGLLQALFSSPETPARVISKDGTIRLKLSNGKVAKAKVKEAVPQLEQIIARHTKYGEGGAVIPKIYLIRNGRIIDFSGLGETEQLLPLFKTELRGLSEDSEITILAQEK